MKIKDLQSNLPKTVQKVEEGPSEFKLAYDYIYNYLDDRDHPAIPTYVYSVNREKGRASEIEIFKMNLGIEAAPYKLSLYTDFKAWVLKIENDMYLIDQDRNVLKHAIIYDMDWLYKDDIIVQVFMYLADGGDIDDSRATADEAEGSDSV